MRNLEKFTQAELTFNYNHYPNPLILNETLEAGTVLLKLWKADCNCTTAKRYVLFLDSKFQFIAWMQFPITLDEGYCAKEIAGMAIACNASNIILSHHRLTSSTPDHNDKSFTKSVFNICEKHSLEILDYLIITHQDCLSYRLWLMKFE